MARSPVRRLRRLLAERRIAGLAIADPVLSAVARAAVARPSDAEARWSARIEAVRSRLEASSDSVIFEIDDPDYWRAAIARSTHRMPPELVDETHVRRIVGEVTSATSKGRAWGRLFHRIVVATRPAHCLELGTSVGMSGSYLGAGLAEVGTGTLVTIEGQPASAEIACGVFRELGIDGCVEVRVGMFAETMPAAIERLGGVDLAFIDGHHVYAATKQYFETIAAHASPGALLVFDDVSYWDAGMSQAWAEIKDDPRVTGSLTIAAVGFAVVGGRPSGHHVVDQLPTKA